MISASDETNRWSPKRWGVIIGLVLVVQAALVFLLENHSPGFRRKAPSVPAVRLMENLSLGFASVADPTFLVLPHQDGISGDAWLNRTPLSRFRDEEWTEPPRLLDLLPGSLGGGLQNLLRVAAAPAFSNVVSAPIASDVPDAKPIEFSPAPSVLRIEGALAGRPLINAPQLKIWPGAELLADDVVQVLVDSQGRTISAVLLPPRSGSADADQSALDIARASQFAAAPGREIVVGRMVFHWRTVPLPPTNAPATIP